MSFTTSAKKAAALDAAAARSLVSQINEGVAGVRRLLLELHDGAGWRALGYETWRSCVDSEFDFGRAHAYRLIEAAQIERRVSPVGEIALDESHARELSKVPDERQAEVYERAARSAPEGKLTARHIRETAEGMGFARKPWGARIADGNEADYREALRNCTLKQLEYVILALESDIPLRLRMKAIDAARWATTAELEAQIAGLRGEAHYEP